MWTELVTGGGRTVVSTVSCSGQRNAERPTNGFSRTLCCWMFCFRIALQLLRIQDSGSFLNRRTNYLNSQFLNMFMTIIVFIYYNF